MPTPESLWLLWERAQNVLPLFLVVFGALSLVVVLVAPTAARAVRMPVWQVIGLGASWALIASVTLTPNPGGGVIGCLTGIAGPAGPRELLTTASDSSLNTWLFVPLGFFAAAGPRWRIVTVFLALLTPWVVEGLQYSVQRFGRSCQYQDVVDNTWGLVLGAFAGLCLAFFLGSVSRRSTAD